MKSYVDSWDMEHERQDFFSFWTIFALLHPSSPFPLTTQRIKILKKWKKHLEISSFYTSVPYMTIIYGSWDMKFSRQNFFVILGHCLPFYPPNSLKNLKNAWIYHYFTQVYTFVYCSWNMACDGSNCSFLF